MDPNPIIGVCQLSVGSDIEKNLQQAKDLVKECKELGAVFVFLPEACDYLCEDQKESINMAHTLTSKICIEYCKLAAELSVWISLGGIHRKCEGDPENKIRNSHIVINDVGEVINVYDKCHLFNVDIPNQVKLQETDFVLPGEHIVCFCCSHYTQAIWRMKNIALPPHHYASFDTKYRSPNEIEWEWVDHDNVPAPITASQACEVEKGTNISVALHCHDNGKYTVTSSCSECDVEIDRKKVVKVVDSPRCFFWKVSVQKQNENFVLQISVSKLQASYHDDPHSAFIPQLFRSRGERPVLTTIVGHDVRIAASNFNASGRFWEVTIHENEILKSEYLYIDSYFHLGMLGCVIMPTVVFANQDENVAIQDESGPLLEPATEIQYKTFTCKCRPHVTVLATKNQLLLTLNNFVTSRKMRIGGNVAAKHGEYAVFVIKT